MAIFLTLCAMAAPGQIEDHGLLAKLGPKDQKNYAVLFSADGNFVYVGGNAGDEQAQFVEKWCLKKKEKVQTLRVPGFDQITNLSLSASGQLIAIGDGHGRVAIVAQDGKVLGRFVPFEDTSTRLHFLAFEDEESVFGFTNLSQGFRYFHKSNNVKHYNYANPSGIACYDRKIGLSAYIQNDAVCVFTEGAERARLKDFTVDNGRNNINQLALLDSNTLVGCAHEDGRLFLFDLKEGKLKKEWPGHPGRIVFALLPFPGDEHFATGDDQGVIRVWGRNRLNVARLAASAGVVAAMAVSRDGKTFAAVGEDRPIIVWDLEKVLGKRPK